MILTENKKMVNVINLMDIDDLDGELHKILNKMKRCERENDKKGEATMRRFALNLLGRIEWLAKKGR